MCVCLCVCTVVDSNRSKRARTPSLTMAKTKKQLHLVLFPWLAFGHIIPYLQLAKLFAGKGHRVSFISTPRNLARLPQPHSYSSLIHLVPIPLPRSDNLPETAEATTDLPPEDVPFLKAAYDRLAEPLARFLQDAAPDWIVHDFSPYWLPPIAARLGISRAFFCIFPPYLLAFFGPAASLAGGDDQPGMSPESLTVPPRWVAFPTNVAFRLHEARRVLGHFGGNESGVSDAFRLASVVAGCHVILVRGCDEIDRDWTSLLGALNDRPVVPVGLLPPQPQPQGDVVDDAAWREISAWLDGHPRKSVVYVAFGSEAAPSPEELSELAHGLALSKLPFLWALKKRAGDGASDGLPEGFRERVSGRGMVWTSWAPQLRILGHDSVGGFLTHCGLSSVVEALQLGLPLIMLPFFADQPLIARTLDGLKVGIEVARDEKEGTLTRDSVAEAVKAVMVGEKGRACKERAKEMMKIFGNHELQAKYTNGVIDFMQEH